MLAPSMSLGLLLALGLIVLSSVDAGPGIKTMQMSMVPNDKVSIKLLPGASRAMLSITAHAGDGSPDQGAVVTNIWGARGDYLCYERFLSGDAPVHFGQAIASIPMGTANDTAMNRYGWFPPTVSSATGKRTIKAVNKGCSGDENMLWQSPGMEQIVEVEFKNSHDIIAGIQLKGGRFEKPLAVPFTDAPGMLTIASGEPGVNIRSVTLHRSNEGEPWKPNKDMLPPTLARHSMMMVPHGSNIKIPFVPKLSNSSLTFSVHNPNAPQMAVIYKIVGHNNGKFCITSIWSMPTNRRLVDYSKVTYAPWDIAASKPLRRSKNIPVEFRYVHGCPGWYGTTRVAAFYDGCKDAQGGIKWDRVPQQFELGFRSEPNGWRLLLNNQVLPGEFVDGWLPADTSKNYNFCVGHSKEGMVVKSISVENY